MINPWPNPAYAAASASSNVDQVDVPARPAEIVEAHFYQAKSQFASMFMMLAFSFVNVKSAVDIFVGQDVPEISQKLASILGMGLGIFIVSSMLISLYLSVKTLLSPDLARFMKLAPHPHKSVKRHPLWLAIGFGLPFAFFVIYIGVFWARSHGLLANGMSDVVRGCLFLLFSGYLGWMAWLHLKRAKEIKATL
jgi:hypothetical protein